MTSWTLFSIFFFGFVAVKMTVSDQEQADLGIEIVHKPDECEREAKIGDLISVHYTGTLQADGTEFDSSHSRNQPFVFHLGRKQVIAGWDQGLLGACKGEQRKLTIPSHLAYGESGAGDKIPPHATLLFDLEVVDIQEGPPSVNVFKVIDADSDMQLSKEEVADYLRKQIPKDMHEEDLKQFDEEKMIDEIFHHEDADHDGFISHDEFNGPKHDEL